METLIKMKLESVYRDAAEYILDMDKKYTGTIIISENGGDIIRSPFSDREKKMCMNIYKEVNLIMKTK